MQERHPLSVLFHQYLEEAGNLHDEKQADYGLDNDPFANVRASADWGMPAWVGCMVRANDKIKRLQTLARKGELGNEPAIDAFMDLGVYAIIGRILFEEENGLLHSGSPEATPDLSSYELFGDTGFTPRRSKLRSEPGEYENIVFGVPAQTVLGLIYEARTDGRLR